MVFTLVAASLVKSELYIAIPADSKLTTTSFEAAALKVAVTLKVSFSAILSCETVSTTSGFSMLSKNKVALSAVAVAFVISLTLKIILPNTSTTPSAGISFVEIVIVLEAEFAGMVIVLVLKM